MRSLILFIFFFNFVFCVSSFFEEDCLKKVVESHIEGKCANQLKTLCRRHDLLFTFWDSSSRIFKNGLTATSQLDLGNYDLCLSIDDNLDNVHILGKYCSTQWETAVPKGALEELIFIMEKYNPMHLLTNKTYLDSFQNVVKYEAPSDEKIYLTGSICIPDACSPIEFKKVFNPYIYPVVDLECNCLTKDGPYLSVSETIITICIGVILLVVIGTTIYHVWFYNKYEVDPHELIKAFSAFHNGKKLITISKGNPDQIQCIHGLRFLSMIWVIAGHSFSSGTSFPQMNKDDVDEWKTKLYSEYIQAGHYAVDTFFFLSGLLLAYGYMKQMKGVEVASQIKGIPLMILNRYIRLTPAVAALFFVSISFFKSLGNGPMWYLYVNYVNDTCKNIWLKYFLYIQNYGPAEDMCYLQTWYLSADMQMFVVAPIVLIPAALYFRKNLRVVIASLSGLIVFCVGLTIAIRYIVDDYTNEYDTHSRLSNYLVGIIGGIIMHTLRGKDIKINKVVNLVTWIITLSVMVFLILYLHDVVQNPTVDKTNFFYALQRPIWSAGILWIVFSCHFGYGGIINDILSIPCFQIGSRLSYCMYIVHFMVIFLYSGSLRTYQLVNDYTMLYLTCGHVVASMLVATIWTLLFEAPMIILNKMLFGKLDSPKK
ncbi:O-acyltransferase like protein-like [Harmonia axyridis]|uniref:O-acyltransferase like protein-like n=1 Tax=Harmonia axyridis TaxID=115357 RepID=UPI001E2770B2|nr:O-acyltransferase like protein-like [Harmonia axyridis]